MQIGFLLFDNVTQLDFTGPLQVLHRMPGAQVHIAAKALDPVMSDCGLALMPTTTLAACPKLDMICVPGGFGVANAFADAETLEFVQQQAAGAEIVSSVCTGAFILGVAGLLEGKRATTHWAYHHLLPAVGAVPVAQRVVRDGNVFTGGGVTAGIDFALTVISELNGPEAAQRIQLAIEYDPSPPFTSGHPSRAPEAVNTSVGGFYTMRAAVFAAELQAAVAKS
jgi:cyclohexyl-isocyanide hydratase